MPSEKQIDTVARMLDPDAFALEKTMLLMKGEMFGHHGERVRAARGKAEEFLTAAEQAETATDAEPVARGVKVAELNDDEILIIHPSIPPHIWNGQWMRPLSMSDEPVEHQWKAYSEHGGTSWLPEHDPMKDSWLAMAERFPESVRIETRTLYAHPPESRLREAAREAVNCLTHHAEDNENTRWVLSLLNTALKEASDERA